MSKKKILIVEDDADVRLGYQVMLRANQFDTSFAGDSAAAISTARTYGPDLIILDLGLPAGDGFVVLERLKTNLKLTMIPVIVVSARSAAGNSQRALDAGAVAYVLKPWNDAELLALIREHTGESEEAAAVSASAAAKASDVARLIAQYSR